ncbi:hypothetical protein QQS21_010554 [Conoideocrella luteorostrata]|uniref:Modin n=1 Tax=Conoideocrella luteorostrata TaxID=1105319 RepID=A0AAJ0FU39_9HYPO|nr:hypothetical protein QQS21_010554 [Conoideocrella luteorostrata]
MVENELIVAVVALLVSVVALSATFMQVLQQYYASARGYSQCNEKVMGEWAKSKSRKFSWDELRYEVQFDAPVIFVSPPTNERGPVPDAKIFFLKGTEESLQDTGTNSEVDLRKEYEKRSVKERIHTADNERASWLVLLLAVQKMEEMSREWQEKQYRALGPPGQNLEKYGLPPSPPTLEKDHTFTVALQRKRKSWDTMPTTVTKPYGTTTMCHLIEMMAALGVYWKQFDRKRDRYRAEGNGFVVLGERISELGLLFSFQVYGKCYFESNRVIPVDEIKELCFGCVPTIYRAMLDRSRLVSPNSELHSLGTLQMASRSEVAETLAAMGLTNNAVQRFLDEGSRTAHLFPISFEILGMLSRTFHIPNSCFTYIPNPTCDRWDKRSFSLVKILDSFHVLSRHELPGVQRNSTIYSKISDHISKILQNQDDSKTSERLTCLNALHAAVNDCDEILTAKSKGCTASGTPSEPEVASTTSHKDSGQDRQASRREIVQDVLRSHVQKVLQLLNERDERPADSQSLFVPDISPTSPRASIFPERIPAPPRFEDVDACGPDDKQHKLMEVYFEVVRKHVVQSATKTTRQRASFAKDPRNFALRRRGSVATRSSVAVQSDDGADETADAVRAGGVDTARPSTDPEVCAGDSTSKGEAVDGNLGAGVPLGHESVSHDDVWCTLVFRMVCWLMLHDFNKMDVQVSMSELLGSRMPVYIA